MISFEWSDKTMSVGIESIDKDHKKLLKIINNLILSIMENTQTNDTLPAIEKLIDYSTYHFESEEDNFEKFNYSDAFSHKKEHERFISNFLEIKKEIEDAHST